MNFFRQELVAWAVVTDLQKTKQGIVVALSLPVDIRERIFTQISTEKLKSEDGLAVLLKFLDNQLGKDDLFDSLQKYDDFENFERYEKQSIQDFIGMFDMKYKRIQKKGMELTPELLAFRLMKKANC